MSVKNVICILFDSLNRHFLECYGNSAVNTPNIKAFADRSCLFMQSYTGSMPCMPARRDLLTGNMEFLWRPWGSLEAWDASLPKTLKKHGIVTQMHTDHYHYFERGGENYHVDFDGYEFIRGHENDNWVTDCNSETFKNKSEYKGQCFDNFNRNMSRMRREKDFPVAKTLDGAARWLDRNHRHERFFLFIDEFTPHEPFYCPDSYWKAYDPDYTGLPYFWDEYGPLKDSAKDLHHIRSQYAGCVTMLDAKLAGIFSRMEKYNLWDNTMVILMTDHGHFLGEHNVLGKPAGTNVEDYQTLAHTPLAIYAPKAARGAKSRAVVQTVDVHATILDAFGVQPEKPTHGKSIMPLLRGEGESIRNFALYGYFGRCVNICDGNYVYMQAPLNEGNGPLYMYSNRWSTAPWWEVPQPDERLETGKYMPESDCAVGRVKLNKREKSRLGIVNITTESKLFNIDRDEDQKNNLVEKERALADKYKKHMSTVLKDIKAPNEQFKRLGLS